MRVPLLLFSLLLAMAEGLAQTSQIEIISDRSSVLEFGGNADSGAPALSADGRFVVFASAAENLTTGITKQPVSDIYLHDRQSGVTRLLCLATNGVTGADGHCWNPQISADGSRVLFETEARNLASTMTNGTPGVLVLEVASNLVWHASVALGGTNASAAARNALLSADGSTVVFESAAINLTTGIVYRTPETPHIFVRHLASDRTELVDVNYRNQEPARSGVPSFSSIVGINSNGTKVAFLSNGTNFVQVFPQSYRSNNLWVRDLTLGTNILVSSFNNQASSFDIRSPSMSADGTKFIYSNGRTNFFRDISQPNAVPMDLPTNLVSPLTISPDGELAAYYRWVSAEGGSSEPVNSGPRIFVGRITDSQFVEVPISASNGEFVFSADSQAIIVTAFEDDFDQTVMVGGREIRIKSARTMVPAAVSADGTVVATEWWWNTNGFLNVVLEETNRTTLISKAVSGHSGLLQPTQGPEEVSRDGRFMVFTSFAALVPEDVNHSQDVYLRDRLAGTNYLVSRALDGSSGNAGSFMPRMTPDGEYVIFVSAATNLISIDTNRCHDVFRWKRADGSIELGSPSAEGLTSPPVVLACSWPVISKDGNYAAFVSRRKDLVPGTTRVESVYLHDFTNNITTAIWVTNTAAPGPLRPVAVLNGPVVYYFQGSTLLFKNPQNVLGGGYGRLLVDPSFSLDEQRMAVLSQLSTTNTVNVYETGTHNKQVLYTYPYSEDRVIGAEYAVSLSGDGKYVAFVTAEKLVQEDPNETNDVYVAEVEEPRTFRLAGTDVERATISVRSAYASLSEDGKRLSFLSKRNDWSTRSAAVEPKIYVVNLPLGQSKAVEFGLSRNPYFGAGYNPPLIFPNGEGVVFGSSVQLDEMDADQSVDAYFALLSFSVNPDVDGDGLPDDWENAEFGDLTETGDGDPDLDGLSNRAEFLAGTDPNEPGSVLRLEIAESGSALELRWLVAPGKEYQVQYKARLDQEWQGLTTAYDVNDGVARANVDLLEGTGFFRIQLIE